MKINKTKIGIILLVILVSIFYARSVSAVDFTPNGNVNLRDYYNITGAPYVNATLYYGNGSQLTGLPDSGNSSFNQSLADELYYAITNPSSFYNASDFSIGDYFNKTDILGFSYYNSSDFTITDYYLTSNPAGYWNDTYATFNKSYADTLYILVGDESSLNVNSSDYWDEYNTANSTWFENIAGALSLKLSELTSFINSWFSGKTTDDLTEGSVNLYQNKSFNQSLTDTLYADITIVDTNASTACSDAEYLAGNGSCLTVSAGGGDLWSDLVDSDIVPDGDNTRDLGNSTNTFSIGRINTIYGSSGLFSAEGSSLQIGNKLGHYGDTDTYLEYDPDKMEFLVGNTIMLTMTEFTNDTIVLAENGNDVDVRMESTGDANNFFSEGGTNRIGIGTATPQNKLNVIGDANVTGLIYGNGSQLTDTPDTNCGTTGECFNVFTGNKVGFDGNVNTKILFASDSITLYANSGVFFKGSDTLSQFNLYNGPIDFRVDGDTNDNVIFMNATTENVGIGTATPQNKLNVVGDANVTGLIYGNGSQLTGIAGGGDLWSDLVDSDIIPDTDEGYDLGNASNKFDDIYMDRAYIDSALFSASDTNTYMSFGFADQLHFYAGGAKFLVFEESTVDQTIFNDDSYSQSVRMESNNDQNNFFSDGINDRVGIGTATPQNKLNVIGDVNATGDIYVATGSVIYFGNGQEANITYNGTNLIISG